MSGELTSNLRPCPHCGADANGGVVALVSIWDEHEDCCEVQAGHGDCWNVVCNAKIGGCGASGGYDIKEQDAIARWNRRRSDEPTEAPEIAARLDKADEFIAESRKEPSCSILSTDTEPSPSLSYLTIAADLARELEDADVETVMQGELLTAVITFLQTGHAEHCDVNDKNIEGIKKPCNCGSRVAEPPPAVEVDWELLDDSATANFMRRYLRREPSLVEVTLFQKELAALVQPAVTKDAAKEDDGPVRTENGCIPGYWKCPECKACNSEKHYDACPVCNTPQPVAPPETSGDQS